MIAAVQALARQLQKVRQLIWRVTGRPAGVHALALTKDRKLVLVKLNYARGWRLPGGGYKRGETTIAAVLRELKEEIGLTAYSTVTPANPAEPDPTYGHMFLVRDVEYAPFRSIEIEEVREFGLDDLPPKLSRLQHYLRDF